MKISKVGGVIAVANKDVAKPLLQVGTIPIVRRIVITYQQVGIFPVVVIAGDDDEELKRELSALGVIFLKTKSSEGLELMDSVRTGGFHAGERSHVYPRYPRRADSYRGRGGCALLSGKGRASCADFRFHNSSDFGV